VLGIASYAFAMSGSVISAFRGQLVISKDELPDGKNDRDTISKIKAAQLREVTGSDQEDVTYWHFHYTAFLSKTGSTKLSLEFIDGGKLKGNVSLDGVDPKTTVQSGDISINSDEGPTKNKTYTVQLINSGGAVVAKTTLTLK
jgi:hypothetical protein